MKRISELIVKQRILIIIISIVLVVVAILLIPKVKINDNQLDYFPDDSITVIGFETLESNFEIDNTARVDMMINNSTIESATKLKLEIEQIDGVSSVDYLDNQVNEIVLPIVEETQLDYSLVVQYVFDVINAIPEDKENMNTTDLIQSIGTLHTEQEYSIFLNALVPMFIGNDGELNTNHLTGITLLKNEISKYYIDEYSLFEVSFTHSDDSKITTDAINTINGLEDDIVFSGEASDIAFGNTIDVSKTGMYALIIVFIIVVIILTLFSTSYFETVIFLLTIFVGILINMGTNYFFGSVSTMTFSIAPIMQLVLTIDYAIFLISRYKRELKNGLDEEKAMCKAIQHSFSPISASSLTTIASFVALLFMQYKMGGDIGFVLGKGVIISIITVFTLLPALIIVFSKVLKKTEHKSIIIKTERYSKFVNNTKYILPVVGIVVICLGFIISRQNDFEYGSGEDTKTKINDVFESKTTKSIVLLIPKEYSSYEMSLSNSINEIEEVESVLNYSQLTYLGLDQNTLSILEPQFIGKDNYNRLIINYSNDVPNEGKKAVIFHKELNSIIASSLIDSEISSNNDYYLVGALSSNIEMKEISEKDFIVTQILSTIFILLILLITFKSFILPFILVFIIQGAISVAMVLPIILGESLPFLAYLIVSAILLGATIDYAILVTSHYLENRKEYCKITAIKKGLESSLHSILPSISILLLGGLSIAFTTTDNVTRMFGLLAACGALTSFVLITVILPQVLIVFDSTIRKTMLDGKTKMK